jgi:TolA-binding protein
MKSLQGSGLTVGQVLLLFLFAGWATTAATGCGGRGGYQADRAVPGIEDRLRDVQRTQDESAKQGSRMETRLYDLQTKVAQLMDQIRTLQYQCSGAGVRSTPAPAPPPAPPPPASPPAAVPY